MSESRLSQVAVEVLYLDPTPVVRNLSQVAVEVLIVGDIVAPWQGALAHAAIYDGVLSAPSVDRLYGARLSGDAASASFAIQRVTITAFPAGDGKPGALRAVECGPSREQDLSELIKPTGRTQ